MNKFSRFFAVISVIVILISCRHQEKYSFMYNENNITSIFITEVCFEENSATFSQRDIIAIDNMDDFFNNFRKLDCYVYYGDPIGLPETSDRIYVIKVMYENKSYELIYWNGQAEYSQEFGFRNYTGYNVFDEQQFNGLISHYLSS